MKEIICDLCIYILRTLKVSVIIGFKVSDGTLQGSSSLTYYYNCDFNNLQVKDKNGNEIDIPHQVKFRFKS